MIPLWDLFHRKGQNKLGLRNFFFLLKIVKSGTAKYLLLLKSLK